MTHERFVKKRLEKSYLKKDHKTAFWDKDNLSLAVSIFTLNEINDMIINLHGLNSTGNNTAYKYLKTIDDKDIKVLSPTYTVYNFKKGIEDIENAIAFSDETEMFITFVATSTGALFASKLQNHKSLNYRCLYFCNFLMVGRHGVVC